MIAKQWQFPQKKTLNQNGFHIEIVLSCKKVLKNFKTIFQYRIKHFLFILLYFLIFYHEKLTFNVHPDLISYREII